MKLDKRKDLRMDYGLTQTQIAISLKEHTVITKMELGTSLWKL